MDPMHRPAAIGVMIEAKPKAGAPDGPMRQGRGASVDPDLLAASRAIMGAFHAKDVDSLARSLKSFFQIVDSEPHDEGEPPEDGGEEMRFGGGDVAPKATHARDLYGH